MYITIPRCMTVGYIAALNVPEFDQISSINEEDWKAKMEKSELVHLPLMSLTEGAQFLNQAKVNVLTKEKIMYEETFV